MHSTHAKILTVGLILLAASPAFAQRQRGQFGGRARGAADLLAIDKDQDERREAFTKATTMRQDAMDKIVNGLNDDQKKTWKDLTGDKFDFPPPMRRPRNNNQ